MRTRSDHYDVEVSVCHSGPVDGPYLFMKKVFAKLAESGITKTGVYNVTRGRNGRNPTHFTWFLGARLSTSSTPSAAKMMDQLLADGIGTNQLVVNVR